MGKLVVIDNINLLPEAKENLQNLLDEKLEFPQEMEATEQQLIERTGNAEMVLVSVFSKLTKNYFNACPSLKYIGICGTSTANVNLEEVKKRGITLTNVQNYGDEPAAEYMFMLLLMLARGEGKYQWKDEPIELMGKSIGIIGLGGLGKAIAHLALGLKMNIYYYSLHRKSDWEEKGVKYLNLENLLQACDVTVISTPTNVRALGSKEFKLMKPNSILMYASSGEALDEKTFLEWVSKNDNFALFNLSAGENYYEKFKDVPHVIFPKIMAGHTVETKKRLGKIVIENLKKYLGKT
jgi:phosphoglycerate dehydrogenase-like enzyme